jgi:hypothetical protein
MQLRSVWWRALTTAGCQGDCGSFLNLKVSPSFKLMQRFAWLSEIFILILLFLAANTLELVSINGCWLKSLLGDWETGSHPSAHKCLCRGNTVYLSVPVVMQCKVRILTCILTFLEYVFYCFYYYTVNTAGLGVLGANCGMCKIILIGKTTIFFWGVLTAVIWNNGFGNAVSTKEGFGFSDDGVRSQFGNFGVAPKIVDNY